VWGEELPDTYDQWRTNVEEDGFSFDAASLENGMGYFSWYRNATLDGVDTPVGHSTLAQFSAFEWTEERSLTVDLKYVAFTYGRADSIIHDPKLGYVFDGVPALFDSLIRGSAGVFLMSAIIFVGMVATVRLYKKRKSMPQRVEVPQPPTPPQMPPQAPPQMPPQAPPQTPPQGPAAAPPQVGYPPQSPPGSPPGGAQ
jgi:hypothetical protein